MVSIERIICGNGNCFLVSNDDGSILVDTARPEHRNKIVEACKNKAVKLIVLTHGHVDHVQNAAYLSRELHAPIAMHEADYELIKDNMLNSRPVPIVFWGKLYLLFLLKALKRMKLSRLLLMNILKKGIL